MIEYRINKNYNSKIQWLSKHVDAIGWLAAATHADRMGAARMRAVQIYLARRVAEFFLARSITFPS